jgi:hypothetical protein
MSNNQMCSHCGSLFSLAYRISKSRAARPKYCSKVCLSRSQSLRADRVKWNRFKSRIDVRGEKECWPWLGRTSPCGYGLFDLDGKPHLAHRLSYFAKFPDGDRDKCVCHSCDNPPCCNPNHLWIGTALDNIADMNAKGRRATIPVRRGQEASKTKLNEQDVIEITASKKPNKELARAYGVTAAAIWNIRRGRSWRHITGIDRT